MSGLTEAQRAALERARNGADQEAAGRSARDKGILAALAAGLSERAVAEGIGRNPDGKWMVSPATINRVSMAAKKAAAEAEQ